MGRERQRERDKRKKDEMKKIIYEYLFKNPHKSSVYPCSIA